MPRVCFVYLFCCSGATMNKMRCCAVGAGISMCLSNPFAIVYILLTLGGLRRKDNSLVIVLEIPLSL